MSAMPPQAESPWCPNRTRALVKGALVLGLCLGVLGFLVGYLGDAVAVDLRTRLSLWRMIGLIVIVNSVFFLVFAALIAAYKWIRRDLEPADEV